MNVENHQTNSRPRPQAVPEVVSLSPRRNAKPASDREVRRPAAAMVAASADAVHPARKSAATNPNIIVEVAPQKPPVAASANDKVALSRRAIGGGQVIVEVAPEKPPVIASSNRGKRIIVEMSPDVTPLHPELNARRKAKAGVSASADAVHSARKAAAISNPNIIVEVAPQTSVTVSANQGKRIIVEMSPDVTPLHPELSAGSKVAPKLSAGRRSIGSQVIVEVSPDIRSASASSSRTDRNRVAPTLNAGQRAVSTQVIVEISPDIPPSSIQNAIEPESAREARPNLAASTRQERAFTKKMIQPEISPDVSPAISASSRRGRAVVPEMAPDLKPLISKAN